jgi:hypothetical protein
MQSGGQFKSIEFTALAAKTGAENSEVPKGQRERIRTRRRSSLWCRSERAYADAKIDGIRLITKRKMRGVNSEE